MDKINVQITFIGNATISVVLSNGDLDYLENIIGTKQGDKPIKISDSITGEFKIVFVPNKIMFIVDEKFAN
jgi:hypothetical protein